MIFARRWILPVAVSACLFVAPPSRAQRDLPEAKKLAEETITQANLRTYLTYIASDELEGRDTPSKGLDLAAKYLADHLKKWKVKPGGDGGTYFQKMTLVRRQVDAEKTTASVGGTPLKFGEDFVPSVSSAGGSASGPLVYVGSGYVVKSRNLDPYRGLDVCGKVLVVANRLPAGVMPRELQNRTRGTDWMSATDYAEKNGAAGVVYLPPTTNPNFWSFQRAQATRSGGRFRPQSDGPQSKLPIITLAPDAARRLFEGERIGGEGLMTRQGTEELDRPFALAEGKKVTFHVETKVETQSTQNVVAVVEGSDPTLKNEYVALGAHYDHVGVGRPARDGDDRIYNGADDDGSGTVALLSMAEALAKARVKPRRSVLFVWHCGEEHGLWGSAHFVENPTVPLESIVAQVNIDMIGRAKAAGDTKPVNVELSGPDEVYLIGSRRMSSELGELCEQVNREYLGLKLNYRYDAPNDPNRFFFRSDHYNYAEKGIPVAFFFDGVHEDYHRPSDEVDKIDFPKYEKVARTVFATVAEIANRPARLKVDKPLSPPR